MKSSLEEQNLALTRENTKLKEQIEIKNRELDKLEHVLLANLAHKEQEIADLSAQIDDMKSSMNPCNQQLRCMGLDPAVNVVFLRIKKEMKAVLEKLEQTQNDLQAWKFTPDSQTGKRMMTRMRVLLQENEELGKMNQSGRTAKLESEIAIKKTLIDELKQTNSEYENVIEEMDTETECFQTSICMLQQQLSIAKSTINELYTELNSLAPGKADQILKSNNWNNTINIDSSSVHNYDSSLSFQPMECGDVINGDSINSFKSDSNTRDRQPIIKTESTLINCDNNNRTSSSYNTKVNTAADSNKHYIDSNNTLKNIHESANKPSSSVKKSINTNAMTNSSNNNTSNKTTTSTTVSSQHSSFNSSKKLTSS